MKAHIRMASSLFSKPEPSFSQN